MHREFFKSAKTVYGSHETSQYHVNDAINGKLDLFKCVVFHAHGIRTGLEMDGVPIYSTLIVCLGNCRHRRASWVARRQCASAASCTKNKIGIQQVSHSSSSSTRSIILWSRISSLRNRRTMGNPSPPQSLVSPPPHSRQNAHAHAPPPPPAYPVVPGHALSDGRILPAAPAPHPPANQAWYS